MTAAATPSPADPVRAAIRPALIMAWALLVSLPLYLLVEEIVRSRFRPFWGFAHWGDRLTIRYGFYLAAAAAVVLLRVLSAVGLKKKKAVSAEAYLGRLRAVALLTLALAEVPALAGLALFFIGGYNVDFYGLLLVSLILLFMYFPRARTWEARLQDAPPICPF